MARDPKTIQQDIDRFKKELKDSKDANYYAARAKETSKRISTSAKKYGSKAASSTSKGAKTLGNKIAKFLTSK